MFSSAAAIFWMYNDSWPVTHGWTIIDYYRRKKLAYHPVRRAFQPVTVVVAEADGVVTVYGVNDTPRAWRGTVRFGLFALPGIPRAMPWTPALGAPRIVRLGNRDACTGQSRTSASE